MADDPEFWRRTEANFHRLQPRPPQPGEAQHDSHNGLCAMWNPDGWSSGDPWYLTNADGAIRKYFRWAAESAAVELGHPGGPSALFYWLDLLRRDSPYYTPFGPGGKIERVCDASADYCLKLETDAKAAGRLREATKLQLPPLARQPAVAGATDDQAESWRRLKQSFTDYISDENEALVAHYESTGDTWRFEGSPESERAFKAVAREAGFRLTRETGLDAIKHWLDALRCNQVAPVAPDSTTDPSTDGTLSRLSGPMPTAIDKLFSRSALFSQEWATEISMRMKFYEQHCEANPDDPSQADHSATSETDARTGASSEGSASYQEWLTKVRREARIRTATLKLAEAARLGAGAALREEAAQAVHQVWPRTRDHLEQVLWPLLSQYAKRVFDKVAEARLAKLSGAISVPKYARWLRLPAIPAIVDDICTPIYGQFHVAVQHVIDTIGEARWPEQIEETKRASWGMLTETISGPHTENLKQRLQAYLEGRIAYWEGKAVEKRSCLPQAPLNLAPYRRDTGLCRTPEEASVPDDSQAVESVACQDTPKSEVGIPDEVHNEEARRRSALAEYKAATGNPSNKRIYEARNSGIHKPQFYEWQRGELPADSATTRNFERFLAEKKPPIARRPRP